MMLSHIIIYFIARHLWKKEYYMQEDLVCNATFGLSKKSVSINIDEEKEDIKINDTGRFESFSANDDS